MCGSDPTTFRVPQDKLGKLQQLLRAALDAGCMSFRSLQRITGKCMSITEDIRPASLWVHAAFAVLAELERSALCIVDFTQDSRADRLGEFKQWLNLLATSQEGPWQRARHFVAAFTKRSSKASSLAWGGVVDTASGALPAGGAFPPNRLSKHINQREMYVLYYFLQQFWTRRLDVLRRAQVLIDVGNQSVAGDFHRQRSKNREAHALLMQLFELQVEYGFMLSLKWIPTAENEVSEAISRPSRDAIIRIAPASFKEI